MNSRSISIALAAALAASISVAAGCGSDSTTGATAATGSGGSTSAGTSTGDGGATATTGTSTGVGGAAAVPEVVVGFDPSKGQFVEGLDIQGGIAYVGALPTGQIVTVDLAKKTIADYGATPSFPQNGGALVGMTLGSDGALYAALNVSAPGGPTTGIYRVAPGGGAAKLFASDPAMAFANDLRFNAAGELLVSDSITGTIFKVAKDGAVSKWLSDPLLTPDPTVCGEKTNFHLGVNGIVQSGSAYYATNTDRAEILKIPVNADGSAGTPEVFVATDCAKLSGADGIALDASTGDLIVAVNYKNTLLKIAKDKTITTLATGEPLQSPASLYVDEKAGSLYVTCAAFAALATDPTKAKPSLLKLQLH
ncbi:MAG: SMP-30/gluconolactonase/LRE family protein [Byssovorax sp.]